MIDVYEFFDNCRESGLSACEARHEYYKALEEERKAFEERYNNDPLVCAGWAQRDLIDSYRRER